MDIDALGRIVQWLLSVVAGALLGAALSGYVQGAFARRQLRSAVRIALAQRNERKSIDDAAIEQGLSAARGGRSPFIPSRLGLGVAPLLLELARAGDSSDASSLAAIVLAEARCDNALGAAAHRVTNPAPGKHLSEETLPAVESLTTPLDELYKAYDKAAGLV